MTVTERTVMIGGVEATVENKDGFPVEAYVNEYEKYPLFGTEEYTVELEAGASYDVVDGRAVRFTLDDVKHTDGITFDETVEANECRFDFHYYVREIPEPDDDEKTVAVNGEDVLVKAVDGELTAEVIEDDFVEYVEDIVGRGKNVVSTRETSGDHDAVIVSPVSHGDMRVRRWIDTLVNDGGIEVRYVGTVDEHNGSAKYETMEDEWVGRAMICVDDVRDE